MREHLRLIAAQEEEKGDISGGTAVVDGAANSGKGDPLSLLVEDDEEWSEGEEDEEKVIGMAVEESS